MKKIDSKGQNLHDALTKGLSDNNIGQKYSECSRECRESMFWIKDGHLICFSNKKTPGSFEVRCSNDSGRCWLVCVDEGIISNAQSAKVNGAALPRCDNLLFDDDKFFYVEAKINLKSGAQWEHEIKDAIKSKIPNTKRLIVNALNEQGYSITQKIIIVIAFSQSSIPRISSQKRESLLQDSKKAIGREVYNLILSDMITL